MGFLLAPVARLENGIADIFSSFFFNVGPLFCLFALNACGTDM